jgi:4-diphosphocytidyl-2-C-methyl-D-erythritol kinase
MIPEPRRARLRALAKVNLTLEVLNKRPDGYHNIRTVFQSISLADILEVEYRRDRVQRITLDCDIAIPENLILRAAGAVLETSGARGHLHFRLTKRIPMGGGLGGGSTDAAAVLLAVPVLTGRALSLPTLLDIGATLGSDVPFFLTGGIALGLGRGTELYPLASPNAAHVLLVAPDVHVSTAEAYRALGRTLTSPGSSHKMNISQSLALAIGGDLSAGGWAGFCSNDFESVVFRQHPQLGAIKNKLNEAGARSALMTGSGAVLFGIFESAEAVRRAQRSFRKENVIPVRFVSRSHYHALWWRQLAEHIEGKTWPPQSRYAR